jgi:hypothetical protein
MNDTKKISIFLPANTHRQLKVKAAQSGTSIQQMMLSAAEVMVAPPEHGTENPPVFQMPSLSMKEKKELETAFRNILEEGDNLAVLNCVATIEAMKLWVENRKKHDSGTLLTMPLVPAAAPAAAATKPAKPPRRKAG